MANQSYDNSGKGFTLVELLVVVSIIALLLAVMIPSLRKAKEAANRMVCGTRLKNMGLANATYANMYNNYYCPTSWPANRAFRDLLKVDSYPKDKKGAPKRGEKTWNQYNGLYNWPKALLCPSDIISIDWKNQLSGVLISYAMNITQLNGIRLKVFDVKRPSEKLVFIDSIDWYTAWPTMTQRWGPDYAKGWDKCGQASNEEYRNQKLSGVNCYQPVIYRHTEGANCLFYDGHAKYMKKQQIFVRDDCYVAGQDVFRRDPVYGMWLATR